MSQVAKISTTFSYQFMLHNTGRLKSYSHQLLILSLEKTVDTHGPFSMNYIEYPMNDSRRKIEALKNTYPNFILPMIGGGRTFKKFAYAPFPIDLGLLGYRFLIRHKDDSLKYSHSTTLEQLKSQKVVQGEGWFDSNILRANGFKSVSEVPTQSIGNMIHFKRADLYFSSFVDVDKPRGEDVVVDDNLMVYYLSPRFFSSSKENKAAIERIYTGLTIAFKDGSLEKLMDELLLAKLNQFKIKNRKIFELNNQYIEGLDARYQHWSDVSKQYIESRIK